MARRSDQGIWVGIGLLAVAALGVLLLRPGSTETRVLNEPSVVPDPSGQPVIAALRSSGGFAPFGLRIVDETRYVEVRFTTEPGCSAQLEPGDPWPTELDGCRGPFGVEGVVGGLGVSADGLSIVGVEFTVPGACYDTLQVGTPWPSAHIECSAR